MLLFCSILGLCRPRFWANCFWCDAGHIRAYGSDDDFLDGLISDFDVDEDGDLSLNEFLGAKPAPVNMSIERLTVGPLFITKIFQNI